MRARAASLSLMAAATASSWSKEVPGLRQAAAFLGIDFVGVAFDGEETGAVEVQVGGEDLLGEGVDAFSVTAGDVAVSEVLADDRAVLALDEGVVVAAAGSGLGELVDVEGLQPGGDFVVDELRTVVGVESADVEGERPEQGFEDGGEQGVSMRSTEPMNWNWVTSSTRLRW